MSSSDAFSAHPSSHAISLENEVKKSYLDYSMNVIVGRALPDCRDGLKPVHRKSIYAMHELNLYKTHKKSARVIGDVTGKYHPHGELAVYEAIVRMAQDFSMRYQLVDGQGNFGSIDGDPPAAQRYTEVKLRPYAASLLEDIDKDTVNFSPNYDGSEKMPDVLPAKVPNLLINGSSGIAVGMATQIPPHNLAEIMKAFLYFIDHPDATVDDLMQYLPGPDFPTAATILGTFGIKQAYMTGKGKVKVRSVSHIEEHDGRQSIVVTELPYQVNKARLIERIAELARDKKIENITALRDESDKDGIRVVIDMKRDTNEQVLLNHLYQHTQLQTVYAINMVALVHGQPQTMTLHQILRQFYLHRQDVIVRRTRFRLSKTKLRAHVLSGLAVALENIDAIIALIKESSSTQEAKQRLCSQRWPLGHARLPEDPELEELLLINEYLPYGVHADEYQLSIKQAESILEMKLHKLTSMEQDSVRQDVAECLAEIRYLKEILQSEQVRINIIKEESLEMIKSFPDTRLTKIDETQDEDIADEDLIPPEDVVLTLSNVGYIKTQPLAMFEAQRRGGKGKSATRLKTEDTISHLLVAHSHDHLLCFSTKGKVYKLRVFELPSGSRQAAGKPIVNCLPLEEGEHISALLTVKNFEEGFIFMTTHRGTVKKAELSQFANTRSSGLICIALDDDDVLQHAFLTKGAQEIMLFANNGKAIRFHEDDVRPTGRTSRGVRGMRLNTKQHIISAFALEDLERYPMILTGSRHGYGKCTPAEDFNVQSRGGMGVIAMSCSPRNGEMISALPVAMSDDVIFLTEQGMIMRTRISSISITSRNTQGVRLLMLNEDDRLTQIQAVDILEQDDTSEGSVDAPLAAEE